MILNNLYTKIDDFIDNDGNIVYKVVSYFFWYKRKGNHYVKT